MESLGTYLRSKRRLKGLKISQVADELKIKPEYIEAMENDRLDLLPTKAHQRIFLKSYAEFLGVDFEKLKEKFMVEEKKKEGEQVDLSSKTNGGLFYIFLGLVLGFLIIGFFLRYAGYKEFQKESEISDVVFGPFLLEKDTIPIIVPFFPDTEDKMLLRLEAFKNSWLMVVGDGVPLFNGIMGGNTTMEFIAEKNFVIRMGKPEVLRGFVNGQILKPFHLGENPKKLELGIENYLFFLDSTYIRKPTFESKEKKD